MVNSSINGDRYINLLTDFGFKRLFGSEPHKVLLIDFLNSILPPYHTVADITYKSNENVGNTVLDRKAIFDLYCKWLFLFRHLSQLDTPPEPLREGVFNQLFELAEIAQFSPEEQRAYQNSLKYYRDLNNVVETSRQEGIEEGRREGIQEGEQKEASKLVLRLLQRRLGDIPERIQKTIRELPVEQLEDLGIALLDFESPSDLIHWLAE